MFIKERLLFNFGLSFFSSAGKQAPEGRTDSDQMSKTFHTGCQTDISGCRSGCGQMCVYLGKTNATERIHRAVCAGQMPPLLHLSFAEMGDGGSREQAGEVGREGSSPALSAQVPQSMSQ